MRHTALWQTLAGCALILAAATSQATVYKIETTDDVSVTAGRVVYDEDDAPQYTPEDSHYEVTSSSSGGLCTLREATYAISYQVTVGACEAGTGNDTIRLLEGETYLLTEGELPVGGRKVKFVQKTIVNEDEEEEVVLDEDGKPVMVPVTCEEDTPICEDDTPISPNITINLYLDAFEDAEDKENKPVISADDSRLFFLKRGGLTLTNLTLQGGNANGSGNEEPGNGGLILARALVNVKTGMTFSGGVAVNGGAIYLHEGADLVLDTGRFEDNVATGKGSVIATSDKFDGAIVGSAFYMAGNEAADGTIYLNGDDATVSMLLSNGVMTNNIGESVIRSEAPKHQNELRNMTIAFNEGVALHLEKSDIAEPEEGEDPPEPFPTDAILNTVLIGNGDNKACAGAALADTDVGDEALLAFTITDDSDCPEPWEVGEGLSVTGAANAAVSDVLFGVGRELCVGSGIGACEPMPAEELGGVYPGFLPNPEPAAVTESTPDAPSLFDRGGLNSSGADCETTDYRGVTRGASGGRCDVGAVEYQRVNAKPDEIPMIVGQPEWADVLANDLNDAQVDCRRLEEYDLDPDTECLVIVEDPDRGTAEVVVDPDTGYPLVRYTPDGNLHGVDQFYYSASRHAFVGGTTVNQDVFTFANMASEPASGLTESKSILDDGAGSASLLTLLMLVAGGLLRRWKRGGVLLAMLLSGTAMAADIEVDRLDHPATPGDGICTLKEALENATPSPRSGDCAYGTSGEDRILLPAGEITLSEPLIIAGGKLVIEGKGARNDNEGEESEPTLTTIRGGGNHRLFQVTGTASGYPGVELRYLSLEDGHAVGSDDEGSGGVIFTGGSVIFDRVILRNNRADAYGGVAYIGSNSGADKTLTFNRAWVTGNHADIAGGVLAVQSNAENTPPASDKTRIAMVGSTFDNNDALEEGGVLDSHAVSGDVSVVNSTFFNNDSPIGSALNFDAMEVDANIINSTFLTNTAGNGIELGDADIEVVLSNSIYFDSGTCSAVETDETVLKNSVYNVFSAVACDSESQEDSTDDDNADIGLLASDLTEAEGSNSDFVPPYLVMSDAEKNTPSVIVDAGNDDDLQSGTSSSLKCRSTDLRGISRTSGGRCDRGAFEYQQITAADDEGNNQRAPDRRVLVDIFDNDLPSDGAEIRLLDDSGELLAYRFTFTPAQIDVIGGEEEINPATGSYTYDPATRSYVLQGSGTPADGTTIEFVWEFYSESVDGYEVKCGEPLPQRFIDRFPDNYDDGDVAENCVVLFIPSNQGFIPDADDASKDAVCEALNDDEKDSPRLFFLYNFEDSAEPAQQSQNASVTMAITNKAPKITGQTRASRPGESVTFRITAEDPDGDESSINWPTLRVKDEPSFTKRSSETGGAQGTGIIIDSDARTVTYIPDSNFSPFKDRFTLEVEDYCGSTSSAATFTITYPGEQEDNSAGSWGLGLFSGLLLLFWRRRRLAAA
ncbi:MAG: hypothetical protein JKY21_05485 [Alcanivorax sp.]|nr:hypothetical protein [Alcanivorax sp.]